MKTTKLSSCILMVALYTAFFTACTSNEEINIPKEKTPVGITASLTGEVVTKADNLYQPTDGTKTIAVYYKDGANTTTTEKGLFTYSSSWTADASASAGHQIFWDDLTAVSTAYPFFAVAPKDLDKATTGSVETDQNTAGNQTDSDLLMAFTSVASASKMTPVDFTFKHMLAKLTVNVDVSKVANASSVGVAVSIKNAIKDYTINYTNPAPTVAVPATIASGSTREAITPKTDTGSGTTRTFSAILPVQEIVKAGTVVEVKITQGGTDINTYTFQPESASKVTLVQAQNTTLTLTVNGTKLELGDIKVTDWTTKAETGGITIDPKP